MHISLCGAAGEETGSGYLVETAKATVLVDFGILQGRGETDAPNLDLGPVKPLTPKVIVLRHAHLDHTRRLPHLPSRGNRRAIDTMHVTIEFAQLVLQEETGTLMRRGSIAHDLASLEFAETAADSRAPKARDSLRDVLQSRSDHRHRIPRAQRFDHSSIRHGTDPVSASKSKESI